MTKVRFQPHHQAVRDTLWVGKGSGPLAWLIVGVLGLATFLAWWLH
jgi:hypothetical protein